MKKTLVIIFMFTLATSSAYSSIKEMEPVNTERNNQKVSVSDLNAWSLTSNHNVTSDYDKCEASFKKEESSLTVKCPDAFNLLTKEVPFIFGTPLFWPAMVVSRKNIHLYEDKINGYALDNAPINTVFWKANGAGCGIPEYSPSGVVTAVTEGDPCLEDNVCTGMRFTFFYVEKI